MAKPPQIPKMAKCPHTKKYCKNCPKFPKMSQLPKTAKIAKKILEIAKKKHQLPRMRKIGKTTQNSDY